MALDKPYHRIFRPMLSGSENSNYLEDPNYADNPYHYVRSFLIIQKDIKRLFEFIEPADINLKTFSFEIYQLLLRISTEIETNFKAILRENIFNPKDWKHLNTNNYKIINNSHKLSSYSVEFPIWTGDKNKFTPFKSWENGLPLEWYQAYNSCKHDRVHNLKLANLENLLNAFSGLFIVLTAQFGTCSYEPGIPFWAADNEYYKGNFGIGDYLMFHFPNDWLESDLYDFNWDELKTLENRFNKFDYDALK